MRVLLAPAGSRGDFQPMLALAVGFARAGHDVLLVSSAGFADEARAFAIPYLALGPDVEAMTHEWASRGELTPVRGAWELLRAGRELVADGIAALTPVVRGCDLVVGGGAQLCGPTAAELAGVPYWFVAYVPQAMPSSHHPPYVVPVRGRTGRVNDTLWALSSGLMQAALGGPLSRARRLHGLGPIASVQQHVFPLGRTVLAGDPELHPLPPDMTLPHPPFGSFHLPDERPLPDELVAFLAESSPPVYLGFGSMPDGRPQRTAALVLEAVERAGVRAVVSAGWAGLSSERAAPGVRFVGPVSHRLLFERVRATVHHGGAGTTAASARAGRPQLVVHHAFDQLRNGDQVLRAGVGPPPIARGDLDARKLAAALRVLVSDEAMRERAARVGEQIRARDAVGDAVRFFERQIGR